MSSRARKLLWIAPLVLLAMALFVFIGGQVVKTLWNWLLPPLFAWPALTFWQALALLVLCRILFGGGLSSGRYGGSGMRRRMREHLRQRYAAATPEEREAFRARVRARWGFDPATDEKDA